MQNESVFGQMSEFVSTVINECRANFEAIWQVFLSMSILVQKCQYCAKKLKFSKKCWHFIKCALPLRVIIFLQNIPTLKKCDFLCEGL